MFKMKYCMIFFVSVSLSFISALPLREARFQDDDQDMLKTLDNYIEGKPQQDKDEFSDNSDDSFADDDDGLYSPAMSLEDLIVSMESSKDVKDMLQDFSGTFLKVLESGYMDGPKQDVRRRPQPRESNTLLVTTTDGNNDAQEEKLGNYEVATMEGLRGILGSAINFLRGRLRRRNETPEQRAGGNIPRRWSGLARNVLDTIDYRLQRGRGGGQSNGGVAAGRGSEDAEMERFGLGKLAKLIFRLFKKAKGG